MIAANFDSRCPDCNEPIEEGDLVGKVDGRWVCEACVDWADGEDFQQEELR
jgi:formylmethanofuran dehydrogenase subunit E